jgi:hypothetical protein
MDSPLLAALRARLGDGCAASFRLANEDLLALTRADVFGEAGLDPEVVAEERALAMTGHTWAVKYNRSLSARIDGYVALGEACGWEYPWPTVAILGLVQVTSGLLRARVYGLAGALADRLGRPRWSRLGDVSEDILRRTNRGIFADSVPTVLRALRARELVRDGRRDLADALLAGHAALAYDAESRSLGRAIFDGLALADARARFSALAATTLVHFGREQAIFTYQMGARAADRVRRKALPRAASLPAPAIVKGKLRFRPYPLPDDFDLRDHEPRVAVFGRAFVTSVTGSPADYAIATAWVRSRFGKRRR